MKRTLIFLLAVIMLASIALAQVNEKSQVLNPLPQDSRAAFATRYNTFVGSQLKHDWSGAYELLSPAVRNDQTKADFTKVASTGTSGKLKSFEPSYMEVTFQSSQLMTAFVVGCGVYEGSTKKQASVLPTSRWSGEWYFAPIQTLSPGAHRAPKECQ